MKKTKKSSLAHLSEKNRKQKMDFLKKRLAELRSPRITENIPAEYTAAVKDYRVECGRVTNLRSQFVTANPLFTY